MSDDGPSFVVSDGDSAADGRIVWILGSGFSAPLGGPMLNDLLSLALHQEVQAQYGLDTNIMWDLMWLFHYGRRFDEGKPDHWRSYAGPGELLWDHAEEFLEFLDSTSDSKIRRDYALSIINKRPRFDHANDYDFFDIRRAARIHIAAECSYFLRQPIVEKRLPFYNWSINVLGNDDVIVTFNYDCVLEGLHTTTTHWSKSARIAVLDSEGLGTWPDGPKALKLHGSTSWVWNKDDAGTWKVITKSPEYAARHYAKDEAELIEGVRLRVGTPEISVPIGVRPSDYLRDGSDTDRLVISTPGPSKYRSNQSLKPWWDKATEVIASADAIVFVGYRFPPSDTYALETLTRAIAKNHNPDLRLHTVLGPKLDDDTVRLQQILNYATRSKVEVNVHRLWSQDFLTVVSRADLL